jgi:8-oxo-dGTP diphosphatase
VVAILRRDGRFLVILRGPEAVGAGYWTPPSGSVEPGESQAQTLVREMREELDLDVAPLEKIWECDTDAGDHRLHWWNVEAEGTELHPEPGEVAEARWVTAEEFLELEPTFAGDREFFERVLPGLS